MRLYTIFCSRAYVLASTPFKLITQLGDQLHQPATIGFNRRFRGKFLPTLLMGFVAVHAHLQMRQVHVFRFPSVTQARHGSSCGSVQFPLVSFEMPSLDMIAILPPKAGTTENCRTINHLAHVLSYRLELGSQVKSARERQHPVVTGSKLRLTLSHQGRHHRLCEVVVPYQKSRICGPPGLSWTFQSTICFQSETSRTESSHGTLRFEQLSPMRCSDSPESA
jgi:hypothetical protein